MLHGAAAWAHLGASEKCRTWDPASDLLNQVCVFPGSPGGTDTDRSLRSTGCTTPEPLLPLPKHNRCTAHVYTSCWGYESLLGVLLFGQPRAEAWFWVFQLFLGASILWVVLASWEMTTLDNFSCQYPSWSKFSYSLSQLMKHPEKQEKKMIQDVHSRASPLLKCWEQFMRHKYLNPLPSILCLSLGLCMYTSFCSECFLSLPPFHHSDLTQVSPSQRHLPLWP